MKKTLIVSIILFFTLISQRVSASLWYVDNGASGTNAGTSWTNAWESFSDISWGSISAGDTIYISGGSTTKEYAERLSIGASGTEGSPITITVGTASPHNGTVQITGQSGGSYGIQISNRNYITIDGQSNSDQTEHIEIYNGDVYSSNRMVHGIYISGTSKYTNIKYIHLHNTNRDSSVGGLWYLDSTIYFSSGNYTNLTGHEISYSTIEDNVNGITIYADTSNKPTGYGGVLVHHNTINFIMAGIVGHGSFDVYNNTFTRDAYEVGHPEALHIYSSYVRIYNNTFTKHLFTTGATAALYWEPDGGDNMNVNDDYPSHFWVYNNTFIDEDEPVSTSCNAISLALTDSSWTQISDIYVFNNTFSGEWQGRTIAFTQTGGISLDAEDVTNVYIVNNLLYNSAGSNDYVLQFATNGWDSFGSWPDGASVTVDYNAYYNPTRDVVVHLGNFWTHSQFVNGTDCQDNAVTADPQLDANYAPSSDSSPVVDAGVDLSSWGVTTDKDGNLRPSGAWDIGAYEYGSSSEDCTNGTDDDDDGDIDCADTDCRGIDSNCQVSVPANFTGSGYIIQ